MPTLAESRIAALLAPYLADAPTPTDLLPQLSTYLDLLLRWNARTNLTAIRDPERIVERHFGESLFCALQISKLLSPIDLSSRPEAQRAAVERPASPEPATILDFGSGAGFPGLPFQLLLPHLHVTLAESQGKKASFLREAVRTLNLPHTTVWANRVEDMPPIQTFTAVTLRAVDNMQLALAAARQRVAPAGWLVTLAESPSPAASLNVALPHSSPGFVTLEQLP
jgi:16S rRNA (guanine527-N7)-methyltransferase